MLGDESFHTADVAYALGVKQDKVCEWIDKGYLRFDPFTHSITPLALQVFIRHFFNEFDLGKVDKAWFIDFLSEPIPSRMKGRSCSPKLQ